MARFFFFFFHGMFLFIYLLIFYFGCSGSSLLCMGFLYLRRARVTLELRCMGFSLQGLLLSQSTGSRAQAPRLGCFRACGIFLELGLNQCPLHWQADS